MIEFLNIAAGLLTIAFGAFGFLAPQYTLETLDLTDGGSGMGKSEMRASVGGSFVVLGLACVVMGNPALYFAAGCVFVGAAAGRALSILNDGAPRKAVVFGGIEALLGVYLVAANWML